MNERSTDELGYPHNDALFTETSAKEAIEDLLFRLNHMLQDSCGLAISAHSLNHQ